MVRGNCVLVAGGNGKLALIDSLTGTILASCDIAPHVDEIAYEPETSRVYCASGTGTISVVFVQGNKLTPLPPLTSAPGCHSIAVDPKTHSIWIAYAKGDQPCVQQFTAK
jgi:DNA-binding beta-propeller fold protein YncE